MRIGQMNRRAKITLSLAAAATALMGTAITTTVTSAHADVTCSNTEICLFANSNFGGTKVARTSSDQAGSWTQNVGSLDDKISSIWNNSDRPVAVYEHPWTKDNHGKCAIVPPNTQIRNVGNNWNDRISIIFTNTDRCEWGSHRISIP